MIILCFTIKLKRLNVITLIMGYWDALVNPKDRKCLASLCTVIYIAWLAYLSKAITVRSFLLFTAFWVPLLKAIWKLVIFPQRMCYSLLGRCQQVFNLCWTSCSKYLLFIIEQIVYTMELVYEYISNIIDNVIPIFHHSVFWFWPDIWCYKYNIWAKGLNHGLLHKKRIQGNKHATKARPQ